MHRLYLDLATAPLPEAAEFIDKAAITAPSNYKDDAKIAAYIEEKYQERLADAALDLDLAQIIGLATWHAGIAKPLIYTGWSFTEENLVKAAGDLIRLMDGTSLVSFNGLSFDWPMLTRRAKYLGVTDFPWINCDRYRSPHVDLLHVLSGGDPSRRRPLGFYVRRHKWTDLSKPLSGAEEAQVPVTGKWAELEASLRHDVEAIKRLDEWLHDSGKSKAAVA